MNLGEVFTSSWKVFWKYKLLWLFGAVPLLIYTIPAAVAFFVFFNPRLLNGSSNPILTYGLLIFNFVYLLLMVAYLFAYVMADASIVRGTLLFDQTGEKTKAGELIKQSLPFYWRVFGLYAIFVGVYIIVMVVLVAVIGVASIATMGIGTVCIFPLFLLFLPLALLAVAFLELSRTSIIKDDIGLVGCLKKCWALLTEKFWNIVLTALVLYAGMYIITMVLYIPFYAVVFVPFFISINSAAGSVNSPDFELQFISTMRWMFILVIPIFSLVSGILNTFIREAWAVAYVRLSRQPAAADLPVASPLYPQTSNQ